MSTIGGSKLIAQTIARAIDTGRAVDVNHPKLKKAAAEAGIDLRGIAQDLKSLVGAKGFQKSVVGASAKNYTKKLAGSRGEALGVWAARMSARSPQAKRIAAMVLADRVKKSFAHAKAEGLTNIG